MSPTLTTAPPARPTNPDPQPISAALRKHFDEELARIPSGKTGQAGLAVTTQGIGVGAGVRRGPWTAAGWAGREWTSGWAAGVSLGVVF